MIKFKFSEHRQGLMIPLFLFLMVFTLKSKSFDNSIVVDSHISFTQAISGIKIPDSLKARLKLIDVYYYSFDGKLHKGQLLLEKDLVSEVSYIFDQIKLIKFPVKKVVPISAYGWNDSLSIADNNTSAFNYRFVEGTKVLSAHARGRAIDINPYLNPLIRSGSSKRSQRPYDPEKPGTLYKKSTIVELFIKKGWEWGGNWRSVKDYQHFEK